GTWRDREGRLVWGVNDFDEAHPLPYTNDLVRLATSAFLAKRARRFAVDRKAVCQAILKGYRDALDKGGRAIVLAERNEWLGAIAVRQLHNPADFWADLRANKPARPPFARALVLRSLPASARKVSILKRRAGAGSLGRQRYVAIAQNAGGHVAREAKAIVPSAVVWATGSRSNRFYFDAIIDRAVRSADPFLHVQDEWVVRRLAPDCIKIALKDLPRSRDEHKLLHAMGWETANVHLGGMKKRVLRDLRSRPARWLERAAADMADAVVHDWRKWTAR